MIHNHTLHSMAFTEISLNFDEVITSALTSVPSIVPSEMWCHKVIDRGANQMEAQVIATTEGSFLQHRR